MSFMLTRMFAYFTLAMYLVVGGVVVRVFAPEMTNVEISTSYLSLFSKTEIKATEMEEVSAPEMKFADIQFPVENPVVLKKVATKKINLVKPVQSAPAEMKIEVVAKNELPFGEPVKLNPIVVNNELPKNLASLYIEFKYEMVAEAVPVEDTVSTKLAADAEPEFFEYESTEVEKAQPKPVKEEVVETTKDDISTNSQIANNVDDVQNVDNVEEEIAVDDLISFDYSKVEQDLRENTLPTVSKVTTQGVTGAGSQNSVPEINRKVAKPVSEKGVTTQKEMNALVDDQKSIKESEEVSGYPNRVTIQLSGTNLKDTNQEVGFELRFMDDLNESIQDYNNGDIVLEQELAAAKMTRAVTVLKRGFAPTNTDLILEEGTSELTLPVIEEGKFNELLAPFESRGPIGAVLVELDENAESATLDVPYSEVIKLDENMVPVQDENFSYQLFVGVQAGNALLSYKDNSGEIVSKIIHIHERELSFDSNFYEDVQNEKVALVEEDLLSKEKNPLIISSEQVRHFVSDKKVKKINDHTFKTDFNKTLLGSRKYLELSHQDEPVFVGFKDASRLEIPSENFMRYILSRLEGSKLGNRCLVQVNLAKKAVQVEVGSEAVNDSLVTYTQILDADGKFYDSIGEKSQKIIVVGENQGPVEQSQDGKINFKITYQDGSVQFLGSYCSPNTYLVEQL